MDYGQGAIVVYPISYLKSIWTIRHVLDNLVCYTRMACQLSVFDQGLGPNMYYLSHSYLHMVCSVLLNHWHCLGDDSCGLGRPLVEEFSLLSLFSSVYSVFNWLFFCSKWIFLILCLRSHISFFLYFFEGLDVNMMWKLNLNWDIKALLMAWQLKRKKEEERNGWMLSSLVSVNMTRPAICFLFLQNILELSMIKQYVCRGYFTLFCL